MSNVLKILWLLLLIAHSVLGKENQVKKKKNVCVIGAGPAGLSSVRRLSTLPDEFEVVAFERNSDVGGLWIYTNETNYDKHGLPVHSSMYMNLRTNAPKELMTYPDYRDFHGEEHSCVSHESVLQYLRNYTLHFNLRKYIKFNTFVELVFPLHKNGETKWLVKARSLTTGALDETECDATMVCNGNLFESNIPGIPGIDKYPGLILHSHSYRKPEVFANRTIVVLGASFSGIDISIETSKYAKKVYLSHRHDKIKAELPSNIEEVPGVVKADNRQLILSNGTGIVADTLIFCTGYQYAFPFLHAKSGIVVKNGKYVYPLYKQLINVNYTTMGILGLARDNVGFSTYDLQARYFLSVLQGRVNLPKYDEMLKDAHLPPGVKMNHAHDFGNNQWKYYDDLAEEGGLEKLPLFYKNGFNLWIPFFDANLMSFRDSDLRVLDDEHVEIIKWKNM